MRSSGNFLSVARFETLALAIVLSFAVPAMARDGSATPNKVDAFLKSMREESHSKPVDIRWTPLLIGAAGLGLMVFAIKQWNRRQTRTPVKSLNNHRKLLRHASREAGVSMSQLKTVAPITQSMGMSSPLVAILCPSTIKGVAAAVKTAEQQAALRSLTKTLLKQETATR